MRFSAEARASAGKQLIERKVEKEERNAALVKPMDDRQTRSPNTLGEPMGLKQVAHMLGVSTWAVRQTLVPAGLPHFRNTSAGKLIFYRDQVVQWILHQQELRGGLR